MDKKILNSVRSRTDAKLRYAKIHLDELLALSSHGGGDFERAHQESYLYHLVGAKESFIQELNVYYSCGLDQCSISPGKLRKELSNKGLTSSELSELYSIENNTTSWLHHAKEMRDHSTHISGVPRTFHHGGKNHGLVFLKNPKTLQDIPTHFVNEFIKWHDNMYELLELLRKSAIIANE